MKVHPSVKVFVAVDSEDGTIWEVEFDLPNPIHTPRESERWDD